RVSAESPIGKLSSPSRRVGPIAERTLDPDLRSTDTALRFVPGLSHQPTEQVTGMSNGSEPNQPAPPSPVDSGSQALAEALRSSFAIVKLVMIVLLAVFLFSGFFTVGPQEKAIILRLGRPLGEGEKALLGAGPHWAW